MKRVHLNPWLLLAIPGGFALRLYHLGADSLWYDETVSLALARSDLAELIRHTAADIHPPLYYILLHFWGQLAGWSEFSAAFLSLLFGVLLIALVYRVALEWIGPRVAGAGIDPQAAGLLAAILVAFSPYNVWYSQEVRMYTLGAFFGLASVHFLLRLLRSSRRLRLTDLAGYMLVTAAGLYTLYYFVFLIAFEYILFAASLVRTGRPEARPRSSLLRFALSQAGLAVLYLPWLPVAFRQATDPPVPPWRGLTPIPQALLESLTTLTLGQSIDPAVAAPVVVLVIGLAAFLLYRLHRRGRPGIAYLLIGYTFVPLALILALSFRSPLYHVRYVFTYSPAFYMLVGLALAAIVSAVARRRPGPGRAFLAACLGILALGSAVSLNGFWNDPRYSADDLRGAVQHLAERWRPGDVILVDAGYTYTALLYYYPGPLTRVRLTDYQPAAGDADREPLLLQVGSIGGSSRLGWNDPQSDFFPTTQEETTAALDRAAGAHSRIWVFRLYDTVTDPAGVIRRYLAGHGRPFDEEGYTGESNARVLGYLTPRAAVLPADLQATNAHLGGRVTLLGWKLAAPPAPGQPLDATLYWKPDQTLNQNYQRSIQLLDGSGQVVAQDDEMPLGNALPTSRWKTGEIYPDPARVRLPSPLAPGRFSLIVKLYSLNSGEVLGDAITLTTFEIGK